jgi:hypothetical protein
MTSVQLTAANGYLFAGRLSAPCHINGGSGRRHGTTLVLIDSNSPTIRCCKICPRRRTVQSCAKFSRFSELGEGVLLVMSSEYFRLQFAFSP